ncbi:hypothetical protein Tco_0067580 [Tanacetum coccineum]
MVRRPPSSSSVDASPSSPPAADAITTRLHHHSSAQLGRLDLWLRCLVFAIFDDATPSDKYSVQALFGGVQIGIRAKANITADFGLGRMRPPHRLKRKPSLPVIHRLHLHLQPTPTTPPPSYHPTHATHTIPTITTTTTSSPQHHNHHHLVATPQSRHPHHQHHRRCHPTPHHPLLHHHSRRISFIPISRRRHHHTPSSPQQHPTGAFGSVVKGAFGLTNDHQGAFG